MKQRLLFVVIVSFLMLVGFAQQGNFGPQGQKTSARSTSVVPASDSANFPVSGTVTTTPPTGASSTQVQGTATNGAATVGNPVLLCGINGGNCVAVSVDSSGRIILGTGAQTIGAVSNLPATVTVNTGSVDASTIRVVQATNTAVPLGAATVSQQIANGASAPNDTAGVARPLAIAPFGFDGTNSDQVLVAALANSAPSSGAFTIFKGMQLFEKGPRWTITNVSSSGAQGTVSIAAAASKRHVVDCIAYSADSAAAITAANTTLNVRDGATGAGTVIWSYSVSFPTATALGLQEVAPQHICGLNLIGTTNTAMTIEFAAAVTGAIQNVNMSGYDIN